MWLFCAPQTNERPSPGVCVRAMLSPLLEESETPLRSEAEGEEQASPLPLQRRASAGQPALVAVLLRRAEAECARLRGPAAASLPPLLLSEALRLGLGTATPGRLSVVQAHVTQLDAPPLAWVPQPLSTLHLSGNAFRTLEGFPLPLLQGLTALSAAHCCLDDVDTLQLLAQCCPQLSDLRLEGNPLCRLLGDARAHALALLPRLRSYDGREVGAEERRAAVEKARECAPRARVISPHVDCAGSSGS